MEEITFEEKESEVFTRSSCYEMSGAFRRALTYIEKHDTELYRELIEEEYKDISD